MTLKLNVTEQELVIKCSRLIPIFLLLWSREVIQVLKDSLRLLLPNFGPMWSTSKASIGHQERLNQPSDAET